MNKFIVLLAIVASAGVASARSWKDSVNAANNANSAYDIGDSPSEFALFESDEKEIAGLGESQAVFKDFCLDSRDEVKAYLKSTVNSGTAKVFNLIAETVGSISNQVGLASSKAAQQGGQLVSENAKNVRGAVMGVAGAVKGTATDNLMAAFEQLKSSLNTPNLQQTAETACKHIGMELKPTIERNFNAYKKKQLAAPGAEALNLDQVRFSNVGCLTAWRLNKVAGGCNLLLSLGPALVDFMMNN